LPGNSLAGAGDANNLLRIELTDLHQHNVGDRLKTVRLHALQANLIHDRVCLPLSFNGRHSHRTCQLTAE
jgi:hypothetical protein